MTARDGAGPAKDTWADFKGRVVAYREEVRRRGGIWSREDAMTPEWYIEPNDGSNPSAGKLWRVSSHDGYQRGGVECATEAEALAVRDALNGRAERVRVGGFTEQEYVDAGRPSGYTWNPYIRMWHRKQSGPCLNCGWQPGDELPMEPHSKSALNGARPEMQNTWEFSDLAAETAAGLRKHFDKVGGIPTTMRLSEAHWRLIVLALERAARPALTVERLAALLAEMYELPDDDTVQTIRDEAAWLLPKLRGSE